MNQINFTAQGYNKGFHYISRYYDLRWFTDEHLIYVEKTSIKQVSVFIYFRFYFHRSCKNVVLNAIVQKKAITSNIQMVICTSQTIVQTSKYFLSILTCDVTWECNAKYFRCHLTPAIECHWGEHSGPLLFNLYNNYCVFEQMSLVNIRV